MPEKYGERAEITHKGQVGVLAVPEAMSQEAFENLLAKSRAEALEEARMFEDEGIDAVYNIDEATPQEPDLDDLA